MMKDYKQLFESCLLANLTLETTSELNMIEGKWSYKLKIDINAIIRQACAQKFDEILKALEEGPQKLERRIEVWKDLIGKNNLD